MTLPPDVANALIALVAVVVLGKFIIFFLRAERVGSLRLQGRVCTDLTVTRTTGPAIRIRLTVAREPGPTAQMRIVVPMCP